MKERPILFSAPMVRAVLAGRKTQTRRIIRRQPPAGYVRGYRASWLRRPAWGFAAYAEGDPRCASGSLEPHWGLVDCPYGQVGDRLWVRETWRTASSGRHYVDGISTVYVEYREQSNHRGGARGNQAQSKFECTDDEHSQLMRAAYGSARSYRWRPSIFMPRWASRITLEVTDVRVERLQDISEDDARAEGVQRDASPCDHKRATCEDIGCLGPTHKASFSELWEQINGERASWVSNPWVWVVGFKRVTP